LQARPLSPVIGAEITGVNLQDVFSPGLADEVKAAFDRYHLLLFRDQEITPEQQERFARTFGPAINTHRARPSDGLMWVSNVDDGSGGGTGIGSLPFHSDHSYFPQPDTSALLLYALEVTSSGGETLFTNTKSAYDELPVELKRKIVGLHALHESPTKRTATGALQPLARCLPNTGDAVIFASQLCTDGISELKNDEGSGLLRVLLDHLYRPGRLYRHTWRAGDVIVWSNRILQHARTDFDPSQRRVLRRSASGVPEDVIEVRFPL
jgi:taurine dioxygenase